MNQNDKAKPDMSEKKSAIDPTDPRQAAFVSGGITGAVAGAAIGSAGGPIGTAAGAAIGGLAGATTAEHISIDTAAENSYWRQNWKKRPYADASGTYEEYELAYNAGYTMPEDIYVDEDASFEDSEEIFRARYEMLGGTMPWDKARPAAKDAFERVVSNRK